MTRVLALDVGTSSVRARVYEADGSPVAGAEAQTRYDESHGHDARPGFDADELCEAAAAALDEARREAGGRIDAVAASCFWHSVVAVDRHGRALMPLLTWRDLRSADAADELRTRVDADAVHARTGCPLHASYWPAKLVWLRRHEPEVFRAADRFLSFSDYLYLRLAGDPRTSTSMASGTGLLRVAHARWDDELLAAVGVEPDRLPEVSDAPLGTEEPWFRALGDGACSNVGAGALGRDRAALMIGTSAAFRVVVDDAAVAPRPRPGLFRYRLDARRVVEGGALSDGGNVYAWLERSLAALPAALGDAAPDRHGLTFLPLLGGERSPGWNARARGAVVGLSFDTGPSELLQAALEGIAFRLAEVADLLPEVREIVGTGGALVQNPAWAQILADVLGRPLELSPVEEASARGAAIVALERLGETPPPPPSGRMVEPRPDRTRVYRAARERQRSLYAYVTGSAH